MRVQATDRRNNMIQVKNLYKEYCVAQKGKGLGGTVKALFKNEKKIIKRSLTTDDKKKVKKPQSSKRLHVRVFTFPCVKQIVCYPLRFVIYSKSKGPHPIAD